MDNGYIENRRGENLSSIPGTHVKPGISVYTSNPSARKAETGKSLGLNGQKSSLLVKFQAIYSVFLK